MSLNQTDFFLAADEVFQNDYFQGIANSDTFYFDQLKDWFEQYDHFDLSLIRADLQSLYLDNTELWDKFSFGKVLEIAEAAQPLKDFFSLIGLMVAVFDEKGYNASVWNPYKDRRRVSKANLPQSKWTYGFIVYKMNGHNFDGLTEGYYNTFKNAVNFIRNPDKRLNVTSEPHRKEIFQFFFPDDPAVTDEQVIALFDRYTSQLHDPINAGVLTTNLLYNKQLKRFWKSEVVGLMAADGTDWHDDFIEEFADYERGIIWNSGTPSGTAATIKALRNKIDEDGSFSLFYKRGDWVRYVADVIDFATNDKELKSKAWDKDYEIYSYHADFAAYSDAKKSARIVFLTTGLKKLKPIPLNLFIGLCI